MIHQDECTYIDRRQGTLSPLLTITLQRQGVSKTLKAWFNPCPHGAPWFVELCDYQGRAFLINVHYPNCHECLPTVWPGPPKGSLEWLGMTERARGKVLKAWKPGKAGQIAWSNRESYQSLGTNIEDAKRAALGGICAATGMACEFAPFVEHYMYDNARAIEHYPHLADDKYVLCASYEPTKDMIRHEPSGQWLLTFSGPRDACLDGCPPKYREEVQKAYDEFLKEHNQRQGEHDAKRWMTWLASEYIKKLPGEQPIVSDTVAIPLHSTGENE